MTTELEEQFFKVFGIEPKIKDGCKYADNYWNNEKLANLYGTFDAYLKEKCPYENKECYTICSYSYDKEVYPEITDRKLLKMICILNSHYTRTMQCCTMLYSSSIASLKEEILKELIDILKQYTELEFLEKDRDEREEEDWIKTKIQQLFKEEE